MTTDKKYSTNNLFNRLPTWLMFLVPLVLLVGLVILFWVTNPIQPTNANLPPIENLNFQRIDITPEGFQIHIANAGPDPVEIAQVLIDEAYWNYALEGNNPLDRLESATINVSYPWVEGEMHEIVLITSSGATFVSEINLATETPRFEMGQLLAYGLVGVYVGIIPIGLGLLWYPAMRRLSRKGMDFILAITVGMLVFLLVDTFLEAIEISSMLPDVFQGIPLVFFVALLTWLGITTIGNRQSVADRDSPAGRRFLALLIATGIGFHNLGEGLVVGAAFALGEAALGSFLVVGFILHNITEGIGIAAPVTSDRIPARWFILPLLIAGAPAILGTLVGGFAFSPGLAVIFLGIGVGAIWQVIFEVGQLLKRSAVRNDESLINWVNVSGLLVGIAVMYFTAFFVKF